MTTIHLRPAPGRACPMPEKGGELLPENGADVPLTAYWQRRINDGDALPPDPAEPAAEDAAEPAAKPATPRRGTKA